MPIPLACPKCKTKFEVPESVAGKRIKCNTCESIMRVVDHRKNLSTPDANREPSPEKINEPITKKVIAQEKPKSQPETPSKVSVPISPKSVSDKPESISQEHPEEIPLETNVVVDEEEAPKKSKSKERERYRDDDERDETYEDRPRPKSSRNRSRDEDDVADSMPRKKKNLGLGATLAISACAFLAIGGGVVGYWWYASSDTHWYERAENQIPPGSRNPASEGNIAYIPDNKTTTKGTTSGTKQANANETRVLDMDYFIPNWESFRGKVVNVKGKLLSYKRDRSFSEIVLEKPRPNLQGISVTIPTDKLQFEMEIGSEITIRGRVKGRFEENIEFVDGDFFVAPKKIPLNTPPKISPIVEPDLVLSADEFADACMTWIGKPVKIAFTPSAVIYSDTIVYLRTTSGKENCSLSFNFQVTDIPKNIQPYQPVVVYGMVTKETYQSSSLIERCKMIANPELGLDRSLTSVTELLEKPEQFHGKKLMVRVKDLKPIENTQDVIFEKNSKQLICSLNKRSFKLDKQDDCVLLGKFNFVSGQYKLESTEIVWYVSTLTPEEIVEKYDNNYEEARLKYSRLKPIRIRAKIDRIIKTDPPSIHLEGPINKNNPNSRVVMTVTFNASEKRAFDDRKFTKGQEILFECTATAAPRTAKSQSVICRNAKLIDEEPKK
jgi:hypothetical protein